MTASTSIARILVLVALIIGVAAAGDGKVGTPAPDLGVKKVLNTSDGKTFDLPALRGRVVLVDFWATWCGPCVAAVPHMQELWDKYRDKGLVVIGHTDGSSDDLKGFIKDKKITYPITVGADIGGAYGVRGIPHVVIIGHDGTVLWRGHPGTLKESSIEEALAAVPAKKK